jgi:hypothetical protein
MLLQFSVTNFRSLRDVQTLSMVSDRAIKDAIHNLIPTDASPSGSLLNAALIYGANASGKSALVAAMADFQSRIWTSFASLDTDLLSEQDRLPSPPQPFLLDEAHRDEGTTYEMEFIFEEVRHTYGFIVSSRRIESEWLHFYPKGYKAKLFERGDEISFGSYFQGDKEDLRRIALGRPDALVLSIGRTVQHPTIQPISSAITIVDNSFADRGFYTRDRLLARLPDQQLSLMVTVLEILGTGICGFERKSRTERTHRGGAFGNALASAIMEPAGREVQYIEFKHRGASGRTYSLPTGAESDGTHQLLALLQNIFFVLEVGGLAVVDELDTSLHTQAAEAIVSLFAAPEVNRGRGQLIATTHNTNLMAMPTLRRDQLWFIEKDDEGASSLYPLSEFETRKGMNVERAYLQGRFGATPFPNSEQGFQELIKRLSGQKIWHG